MGQAYGLMGLAGLLACSVPAAAGSAPLDPTLLAETQPGFDYPGPFNAPRKYIVYQRPLGAFVWNGRWYVYHDPYLNGGRGRVLRRSY